MSDQNKKGIIFNVDDFGPMDFINRGTIEGIEAGIVNSVSVFVTYGDKSLHKISDLYSKYKDKIKIGLHFTMTAGCPIGSRKEVGSLYKNKKTKDKRFCLVNALNIKKIKEEEVKRELELQLKTLGDILGGTEHIDHLNSHQNVLTFVPAYWNIALNVANAKNYNLPLRSPSTYEMRHNFLSDKIPFLPIVRLAFGPALKSLITHVETALTINSTRKVENLNRIQEEAKSKGFRFPDFFIQSYFGQPSSKIVEKFIKDIQHGENGEFLLHIGRGDYKSEYNRKKHWGIRGRSLKHREAELDTLLDMKKNNLFNLLAEQNVELVNYGLV